VAPGDPDPHALTEPALEPGSLGDPDQVVGAARLAAGPGRDHDRRQHFVAAVYAKPLAQSVELVDRPQSRHHASLRD
jgi:hypothetical protein